MSERLDLSDPTWPRMVEDRHLTADQDHTPDPVSEYGDDTFDNCRICGLCVTSDGKRHGTDAC